MTKQLNVSCGFQNGLLVCELTSDVVEKVLKVKMRWGKHTPIEDKYNRTEKFHPLKRADRRVRINTKEENVQTCTGPKLK